MITFCDTMNKKQKNEKYEMITKFTKEKYKAPNTIKTYNKHLTKYFDWVKQKPEQYIKQKRNFQKDIEKYYEKLYLENVPPKTRKVSLASIKVFMLYNLPKYDERLPPSSWYKLTHGKYKGSSSVVNDKVPTVETLRKILMGANLRSKTLFMMLATSGMRISEALSIRWDDINFKNNPTSIELGVEITKTNQSRTVFITPETTEILLQWEEAKEDYAKKRENSWPSYYDAEKVFPFSYQNALVMWWTLLTNSKNSKKDHTRYIYHPHVLRKFFRSRLSKVLPPDYIEFLMGHDTPRTKEYLDLPVEELGEEYLNGLDRLLIFQTVADTSDIRGQLKEKEGKIKSMEETIKLLELRMQGLENKYEIEKMKEKKHQ